MEKASGSMLGVSLRGGEVFFWWYVRRVRCIFETEASEPGYYWCAGREAPGTPDPPNNRIYHNATHRPPTFTEKETLFCETKKIGLKCLQLHPCNTIWMRVIWWLWSCQQSRKWLWGWRPEITDGIGAPGASRDQRRRLSQWRIVPLTLLAPHCVVKHCWLFRVDEAVQVYLPHNATERTVHTVYLKTQHYGTGWVTVGHFAGVERWWNQIRELTRIHCLSYSGRRHHVICSFHKCLWPSTRLTLW